MKDEIWDELAEQAWLSAITREADEGRALIGPVLGELRLLAQRPDIPEGFRQAMTDLSTMLREADLSKTPPDTVSNALLAFASRIAWHLRNVERDHERAGLLHSLASISYLMGYHAGSQWKKG